ncbi:MAG TPA: hypothetical protein VEZ20_00545 [Allosphingosinicella sp.]|jgi:hypothetical protein|nr:hypothetical protein [Allosphingosinicella sp.]
MRLPVLCVAFAFAAALPFSGEAAACIYLPLVRDGPAPSARELADERASHERALRIQRRERAAAALARGMDPAGPLADMLVPNVRPIRIHRSDCGAINEVDPSPGEETPEDWLRGTRLAGRADDFARIWRIDGDETLGPTCNAEVRGRFAAHLRRRLSPRQLHESYLFLGSYWDPPRSAETLRWRLAAFASGTRRPPLRWAGVNRRQEQEIGRWTRLVPSGRVLRQAMDDFWRETEPLLGDTAAVCPQAAARWPAEQARLVDMLDAQGRR